MYRLLRRGGIEMKEKIVNLLKMNQEELKKYTVQALEKRRLL